MNPYRHQLDSHGRLEATVRAEEKALGLAVDVTSAPPRATDHTPTPAEVHARTLARAKTDPWWAALLESEARS